jgi:uncharacterized protein
MFDRLPAGGARAGPDNRRTLVVATCPALPAMKTAPFTLFAFFALALAVPAPAAGTAGIAAPAYPHQVLLNSELCTPPRSANGRDYLLYVALPPDYATEKNKRYPVLYICDGYWDFVLINGFYGNLIYDKVAPHFIIVGFGYPGTHSNDEYNVLRRPDYAPPPEGHADKFLSVVEHEFIPFIEKEYRTDPSYRVLSGNSLGGTFSLYAMFARPGLFQAHVAASPAVPPALVALEEKFAASKQKLTARLFLTGAEKEDPDFLANIKRFNERLASRRYEGFVYQWRLIDGEKHTGTKAESYSRGMRFAFAPLAPKD